MVFAVLVMGEVWSGVLVGALSFFSYRTFVVRWWLLADHTAGLHHARQGHPAEALTAFRRSEQRWANRPWLDKHRAMVLGSASRFGFWDQATYNHALSLFQLDQPAAARQVLAPLLARTPEMGPARALWEHLEARARDTPAWDPFDNAPEEGPQTFNDGTPVG